MKATEALEYLAWKSRVNLFGDFVDKFAEKAMELFSWNSLYAMMTANDVYNHIEKHGLVETYQEYIQDQQVIQVLCNILDS